MDYTIIVCTIITGVLTIIAGFGGAIIGAYIQSKSMLTLIEKETFKIAQRKFTAQMMPFFNEINTLPFKEPINVAWSYTVLSKILPVHRAYIDEFRFSIPEKNRYKFNTFADKYCFPTDDYSEDNIKEFLLPDGSTEREKQIRKDIKKNLEKLMNFTIKQCRISLNQKKNICTTAKG